MNKANIIKCIVGIVAVFVLIFVGYFIYATKYQVKEIDTKTSTDGKYAIILQQVGEPKGLFGEADGRLTLKQGNQVITNYKISVSDDGCPLGIDNWRVYWDDNGSDINIRRYLAYNKNLDNGKKSEIIYFEAYEREENSANNATLIKGVFEVDKETLEIWFDDRTYW